MEFLELKFKNEIGGKGMDHNVRFAEVDLLIKLKDSVFRMSCTREWGNREGYNK